MSIKDIEPIWKIPDSWVWTKMGVIADVVGGSTPRTDDPTNWEPATIPWVTPADLSGYTKKTISHGRRFISEKGLNTSGARLLPAGTVLFSSRAPIGYVAIAANPLATNQGFKNFVLNGRILPDYIYYYLVGNKHLALELAGGTTFAEISGKKAAEIPVCIPPLAEQDRIVGALEELFSKLDAAVTALERVRANLKRYRASVLKAACEGRLVPTEAELARREGRDYEPADVLLDRILKERRARWEAEEWARLRAQGKEPKDDRWKRRYKEPQPPDTSGLPELPEGWVWASIEQLGQVIGGITKNRQRGRLPLKVPYLRVANVYANELRLDDIEEIGVTETELQRVLLCPGDLLIVEGNGSRDQIGRVALWDGSIYPCAHQNHLIKIRLIEKDIAHYVLYWLLSPLGRSVIEDLASSTSGLYTLSLSKVAAVPVPLPPTSERHRIIDEVESRISLLDSIAGSIEVQFNRAHRLRQSILKRAFEGRLVPQDPSDEPASVLLERIRAERDSVARSGRKRRGPTKVAAVPQ